MFTLTPIHIHFQSNGGVSTHTWSENAIQSLRHAVHNIEAAHATGLHRIRKPAVIVRQIIPHCMTQAPHKF